MKLIRQTHDTVYAAKNGRLVHIFEVDRGADCGCVCVVCGGTMVAKKGM